MKTISETAKYEISFIEEVKNPHFGDGGAGSGDEFIGGDSHPLAEKTSRSHAIILGKTYSKNKIINGRKVHEVLGRFEDYNTGVGEIMYIKNGKATHKDTFEI